MNRQNVRVSAGDSQQKVVEPNGRIKNHVVRNRWVVTDIHGLRSGDSWNWRDVLSSRSGWWMNEAPVHHGTSETISSGSCTHDVRPERRGVSCRHVPLRVRVCPIRFVICQDDIVCRRRDRKSTRLNSSHSSVSRMPSSA